VLPARLRRRVAALQEFTVSVPPDGVMPTVQAEVLGVISAACRDREQLRFSYTSHEGAESRRRVEPYRLVTWGRRWLLVAWDVDRADWRTFRVDRLSLTPPHGPRFVPRALPADDLATYVARGVSGAAWRYRARLTVQAPAGVVARRLPAAVGPVEEVDADTCIVNGGAESLEMLALYVGMLDAEVQVLDNPELVDHLAVLAHRYRRAAGLGGAPSAARDDRPSAT